MREFITRVDDVGIYHIEKELIRCEDCVYFGADEYGIAKCKPFNEYKSFDGYCDLGERKEK